MDQQNLAPGSTEFRKKIHQCMVKIKCGKTYAVGIVMVSHDSFCYVITDKAIFPKERSKPYTVVFPQGDKQNLHYSDIRFGDRLAGFYIEKPNDTAVTDAVSLSFQPVFRHQTCYLFDYTQRNKMYSGTCGGNVSSTGVDTFKHDATSHLLGGPILNDERQLIGVSTRKDCFNALGATLIRNELLGILHKDDSLVDFGWTMDEISEHVVNTHVP